VDERGDLRIKTNQPVAVTLLGESESLIRGRIIDYTGRGLGLELERPVSSGAAVRIDWDNRLLLGEVCYCRTRPGGYHAGVSLKHVLFDTRELERLRTRILSEDRNSETVRSGGQ
jgi:hypothetical protein